MCDRGVISSIAGKECYVDARILSQAPNEAQRELPDTFQPGPRDVICSRGADCFNNPGNKIFRDKLSEHLEAYAEAPNKMSKGIIVSAVIDEIREKGGSFVRLDPSTGQWFEVGDRLAREKTGQALRSALRKSSPSFGNKATSKMCQSPVSLKSSASTVSHPSPPRSLNSFGEHLGTSDRSLRTNASPQSLQIPTTLSALTGRQGGVVKLQSSRTWSAGDGGVGSPPTAPAAPPTLRRALTDPTQMDDDDASFDLPYNFLEGRFPSAPPPPPPDLHRQISTWSSVIDRLPGLLDYDPYTACSNKAAPALRRGSSDFFGSTAMATNSITDGNLTIPLEIELIADPQQPETSSSSLSQQPRPSLLDDDELELNDQ